ncbi:MAG: biopolymer transporter ExbD [Phycisphaerales bacterium]|nr:biopolymer transporter ExbD [Phycisphaerales bacterium]
MTHAPPPPPMPIAQAGVSGTAEPRRRRRQRHSALEQYSMHFGPNMTPMVDVVMVILIFFMASAAFLGSEWFLRAAIPTEQGKGGSPTRPADPLSLSPQKLDVVMDVDASGATVVSFLQINRGTLQQVVDRLASFPKDENTRKLEIVIKPTPAVPYRDVVLIHAACDAAGIDKVGIGVTKGK